MLPETESIQRIDRLRKGLRALGLDAALFVYPVDIFYFTGTRQNAVLWVPVDGMPLLLVRKGRERAQRESAVPDVFPFPPSRELPALFGEKARKVGCTFDVMPVQHHTFYANLLPGRNWVDISPLTREIRSVKSAWELDRMGASGRRLVDVFAQIHGFLRPGMRELDLAAEIEYLLKLAGSEGRFRMRAFGQDIVGLAVAGESAADTGCFDGPITGRGISASAPYGPSTAVIRENSPIIVDYAGVFDAYVVDMTRIFVLGSLTAELERAFEVSVSIQSWLQERLRPGNICERLYTGAVKMAEEAGLAGRFMGVSGEQAKFVGHGVGLELDELPVLANGFNTALHEGQTIAIEPKFVFAGQGAVGIENTFAVTAAGGERLTNLSDALICC